MFSHKFLCSNKEDRLELSHYFQCSEGEGLAFSHNFRCSGEEKRFFCIFSHKRHGSEEATLALSHTVTEGEALSHNFHSSEGKKADFFLIIPLFGMFGSGSGCVIRIWGSADPDPSEMFTDPEHWFRRRKADVVGP